MVPRNSGEFGTFTFTDRGAGPNASTTLGRAGSSHSSPMNPVAVARGPGKPSSSAVTGPTGNGVDAVSIPPGAALAPVTAGIDQLTTGPLTPPGPDIGMLKLVGCRMALGSTYVVPV